MSPAKVTRIHVYSIVEQWAERGLAQKTRRMYHNALRWCLRAMLVPEAIVRMVPIVKCRSTRERLVPPSVREQLIEAAPPALRLYLLLISDLALRAGTAVQVSPSHYRDGCIVVRTKASSDVVMPVTERMRAMLNACLAFTGQADTRPFLVLLGMQPGRWLQHRMSERLAQLCRSIGLEQVYRSHDFRRSTARAVYAVTGDLRSVQSVLGHSNLRTSLEYLQPHTIAPSVDVLEAAARRKEPIQ